MNVTSSVNLISELFGLSIAEFNDAVAEAEIACSGIIVLPLFNGERVPNLPDARESILGLNAHNMTQNNLCRAIIGEKLTLVVVISV